MFPKRSSAHRRRNDQGTNMRHFFWLRHLAALLTAAGLSGCGWQRIGQGEPAFDTALLLPSASTSAASPYATVPTSGVPPTVPQACAGQATSTDPSTIGNCVYALKTVIDDSYREYRITLHHFADDGDLAMDIGALGLTTAATLTPAAAAKTILAAMSTGLQGSKATINEDLLYKQTIEMLISEMDSDRAQQFNLMLQEQAAGGYSMSQAMDDLLEYYADGTWDHALTALQARAALTQATSQATLIATKTHLASAP